MESYECEQSARIAPQRTMQAVLPTNVYFTLRKGRRQDSDDLTADLLVNVDILSTG